MLRRPCLRRRSSLDSFCSILMTRACLHMNIFCLLHDALKFFKLLRKMLFSCSKFFFFLYMHKNVTMALTRRVYTSFLHVLAFCFVFTSSLFVLRRSRWRERMSREVVLDLTMFECSCLKFILSF